ncbi:hypothetical protein DFH29DRAFT_1005414 [Suillus ampliporus]|nr:hypothetical protein DFH29DRAFT_1005414 [Suillus ampliporus]
MPRPMHQEMDSQVTALDQQWAQKFATMEKRMQDIESQTDGNVASIGYIANALANPTTARFASFVPPPTKPSAQDAGQPLDHAVSKWADSGPLFGINPKVLNQLVPVIHLPLRGSAFR